MNASRDRLRIEWLQRVTPGVDAALALSAVAPSPQLLQAILDTPGPHPKTIGLLSAERVPVGVVPLRRIAGRWEPLFSRVVPQFPPVFGVVPAAIALPALGRSIFVRDTRDAPRGRHVRWAAASPAYDLVLRSNPEEFWRRRDRWHAIAASLRRTTAFELVVDSPECAKWTIEAWSAYRWRSPETVASLAPDRISLAEWGMPDGHVRSWGLRRDGEWAAGIVGVIVGDALALSTIHRDRDYNWYSPGTRLLYETVMWAKRAGLGRVQFGTQQSYKRYWAPPDEVAWTYAISPLQAYIVEAARARLGGLRGRISASAGHHIA